MGLKLNGTSLKAALMDLDLAATGNMTNKRIKDKAVQRTGPVSLKSMQGNLCGSQMKLNMTPFNNGDAHWLKRRDETSIHSYLSRTGSAALVGDSHYTLTVVESGGGGGDRGTEARLVGTCTESGTYHLTGSATARFDGNYYNLIEIHCVVVSNQSDYLVGNQVLSHNFFEAGMSASKNFTWNFYFTLSTAYPYVTVIMRNIAKSGGSPGRTYTHDFYNTKVMRIS